jgi:hypothetical protein
VVCYFLNYNQLLYRRDNIPTVLLESWPLAATMWDGNILAGPVPTLFAEDADLSSEALAGDPAKAHGDLAKLYRAFFMPEHLQLTDAVELLRKPRAGAALFSFRRGKYSVPEAPTSPAPKRRRPDEDEETGNPSSLRFIIP